MLNKQTQIWPLHIVIKTSPGGRECCQGPWAGPRLAHSGPTSSTPPVLFWIPSTQLSKYEGEWLRNNGKVPTPPSPSIEFRQAHLKETYSRRSVCVCVSTINTFPCFTFVQTFSQRLTTSTVAGNTMSWLSLDRDSLEACWSHYTVPSDSSCVPRVSTFLVQP